MTDITETADGSPWGSLAWGDSYGGVGLDTIVVTATPGTALVDGLSVTVDNGSRVTATATVGTADDTAIANPDTDTVVGTVTISPIDDDEAIATDGGTVTATLTPGTADDEGIANDDAGGVTLAVATPGTSTETAIANDDGSTVTVVGVPSTATGAIVVEELEHEVGVVALFDIEKSVEGVFDKDREVTALIHKVN